MLQKITKGHRPISEDIVDYVTFPDNGKLVNRRNPYEKEIKISSLPSVDTRHRILGKDIELCDPKTTNLLTWNFERASTLHKFCSAFTQWLDS